MEGGFEIIEEQDPITVMSVLIVGMCLSKIYRMFNQKESHLLIFLLLKTYHPSNIL